MLDQAAATLRAAFEITEFEDDAPMRWALLRAESGLRLPDVVVLDTALHRGARAIRHLSLRVPVLIPLGLFLWVPGVIWVAERIYAWVSRNRHLLSRFFGCAEACSILPAREREGDIGVTKTTDGSG